MGNGDAVSSIRANIGQALSLVRSNIETERYASLTLGDFIDRAIYAIDSTEVSPTGEFKRGKLQDLANLEELGTQLQKNLSSLKFSEPEVYVEPTFDDVDEEAFVEEF